MRVLSVAFPAIPVGTVIAAGAEQVLSMLDAGIVERGHKSVVIAAAGSKVFGQLIESSCHKKTIDRVLAADSFDVIHFHGLDFWQYLPETELPMLVTLHLPVSFYPEHTIEDCRSRGIFLNCVSRSQESSSPLLGGLPVISNGIRTQFFVPDEPGGYALWLGRICPEKGTHFALEAARRVDISLIVAGPVYPYTAHQEYFSQYVEPLLDDKRRYIGPVGLDEKRRLLSRADCLLVPCLVAETSSLVAMEALSCGTPVVAFRQGALPEIVDDGETGFIVGSVDEMPRAIAQARHLSRRLCRERAVERFDARRMIEDYLPLYRRMITRRFSMRTAPHENL
ncbi:MAG TPA: glycosyltransferase family 4 protein [Bryobacteraceae bacterium]|nr:glycosyltransferase family 4 protein [Bryobacteraceae bacterium]